MPSNAHDANESDTRTEALHNAPRCSISDKDKARSIASYELGDTQVTVVTKPLSPVKLAILVVPDTGVPW